MVLGILLASFLVFTHTANAATPQLQVSRVSGNQVQVTVYNADSFSQVDLYNRVNGSSLWSTFMNIGRTDGSGNFNTTGFYASMNSGLEDFYVRIGSGQSNTVAIGNDGGNCGYYYCNNTITFSNNNLQLYTGQSQAVAIYGSSGGYYISQNTNSAVVSASLSGSTLNVYANQNGTSTITICGNSFVNQCGNITVSVGGSGGGLTISPNSINVTAGQSQVVSIYGGSGNYYMSGNTDSSVASVSLSGSQVTIYAYRSGSTTATICTSYNQCGSLYITVTGSNTGGLYLSQSSVSVNVGQAQSVSVSGGSGNYYISQNTNSSVASASVAGAVINVYGQNAGTTTVTVCSQYSQCASFIVTVGGYNSGSIYFSQNNVSIDRGQNTSVVIYSTGGGSNFYVSSNDNPGVVTASINGNALSLFGASGGTARISICANNSSGCGTLTVTVTNTNSGQLILSENNLSLSVGQSRVISSYGAQNNQLYVSANSNPSVASASVNGSSVTVYAQNSGTTYITVCVSLGMSACANITVQVSGYSNGGVITLMQTYYTLSVNQYTNMSLQATGGTTPYTFSLASGNFPFGVSLGSSGQLYGSASQTGTFTAYVRVSDYYGRTSTVPVTFVVGNTQGLVTYHDGSLIKDGSTIYIIYNNTKTAFGSWKAFTGLGFSLGMVMDGDTSSIPQNSYVVISSNVSHPWGSWIVSGKQIYFVHEQGLIPVPSLEVFYANNGSLSHVVKANSLDLKKNRLSVMDYSDYRVR